MGPARGVSQGRGQACRSSSITFHARNWQARKAIQTSPLAGLGASMYTISTKSASAASSPARRICRSAQAGRQVLLAGRAAGPASHPLARSLYAGHPAQAHCGRGDCRNPQAAGSAALGRPPCACYSLAAHLLLEDLPRRSERVCGQDSELSLRHGARCLLLEGATERGAGRTGAGLAP